MFELAFAVVGVIQYDLMVYVCGNIGRKWTRIPFVSTRSTLRFPSYDFFFEISPRKFKVKVIVQGHMVGPISYRLAHNTCFLEAP